MENVKMLRKSKRKNIYIDENKIVHVLFMQ